MREEILWRKEEIKQHLTGERYEHTLGVMYMAAALAMRYQEDVKSAMLAGLLHDCLKCTSLEQLKTLANEYRIPLTAWELSHPVLLHGKIGAVHARIYYKIEEESICEAISCHTTGSPNMSNLAKILYIADYIEPSRRMFPGLEEARRVAFEDLDKGLLLILEKTLTYLQTQKKEIDPRTKETYDFYKKLEKKEDIR